MNILGVHFATPLWLYAAAVIPFVYLASRFLMKQRQRRLAQFSREALWDRIIPELDWGLARRKFLFWCLSAFFFLIALARPQWGETEETLRATGLDAMILFDVSRSMEVEDVVPSRLLKTKRFIRRMLERMQGDRAGLVLYAGSAHLQSPLTTDLNYIRELVEEASPNSVSNQGTDIGSALEVAVRALNRGAEQLKRENESMPTSRVILLFSDGEDHEKQIEDGVSEVKDADLKLYVFGVGTERGGPIPMRDQAGQNFGFKRDRRGETVTSKADATALSSLASAAGGRYWTMSDSEMEIDELMAELDSLSRGEFDEKKIAVREERYQFFVAFGILFIFIELFSTLRRKRAVVKQTSAITAGLVTLVSAGSLIWAGSAKAGSAPTLKAYRENQEAIEAFEKDRIPEAKQAFGRAQVESPYSPDLSYNQGVVQLREGRIDEAIQGFQRAEKLAEERGDYDIAARALYNEGVAQTLKKDSAKAAEAYVKALEANQKDPDPELERRIRKNLELLSVQPPPKNENSQDQSDQKQESESKDQKDDQSDSNQSGKNQNSGDEKDQEKKPRDGDGDKQDQQKEKQGKKRQKREFKSEKLTPQDAERVMSELSRREKELKQRLENQKGRPQSLEKDW